LVCNLTVNASVNTSNVVLINSTNSTSNFAEGTYYWNLSGGTYHWNLTCLDSANNIITSETRSFTIVPRTSITINLSDQINLISVPVEAQSMAISSVLENLTGDYSVYGWSGTSWRINNNGFPVLGNLNTFNVTEGYWVSSSAENDSFSITGVFTPSTIPLFANQWNLIGIPALSSVPITSKLNSALYDYQVYTWNGTNWRINNNGFSVIGKLNNFEPTAGYWVSVSQDVNITT
jgi:hypothetical protein